MCETVVERLQGAGIGDQTWTTTLPTWATAAPNYWAQSLEKWSEFSLKLQTLLVGSMNHIYCPAVCVCVCVSRWSASVGLLGQRFSIYGHFLPQLFPSPPWLYSAFPSSVLFFTSDSPSSHLLFFVLVSSSNHPLFFPLPFHLHPVSWCSGSFSN